MSSNTTELFQFLNSNRLDVLQKLLTKDNVNATGVHDQSLLHIAVGTSNLDAVRLLLSLGAKVDAVSLEGDTPLIFAASKYNYEIAKMLLEACADPNLKGSRGMTALRWAVTNPSEDFRLVRLLLQYGADPWIENNAGSHSVRFAERVHPDLALELRRTSHTY